MQKIVQKVYGWNPIPLLHTIFPPTGVLMTLGSQEMYVLGFRFVSFFVLFFFPSLLFVWFVVGFGFFFWGGGGLVLFVGLVFGFGVFFWLFFFLCRTIHTSALCPPS